MKEININLSRNELKYAFTDELAFYRLMRKISFRILLKQPTLYNFKMYKIYNACVKSAKRKLKEENK